ncbi:MAG: tetratricopeptide repeat protein [Deltaproteobacteria bacterium]|nr:MAG: tetratricopeptide repeat protein [Deltaproteobacteria bacterium]
MKRATFAGPVFLSVLSGFLAGCLAKVPAHPEAQRLNLQAARELQQGRLDRAATRLAVSLEYNPCYAEALHNLALVELSRGRLELAEKHELEAIECRPELVQAVNGLGVIYWRQGRKELAMEAFARALELDPGCIDARKNLVLAAVELGDCTLAKTHLARLELLVDRQEWVSSWERIRCPQAGHSDLEAR